MKIFNILCGTGVLIYTYIQIRDELKLHSYNKDSKFWNKIEEQKKIKEQEIKHNEELPDDIEFNNILNNLIPKIAKNYTRYFSYNKIIPRKKMFKNLNEEATNSLIKRQLDKFCNKQGLYDCRSKLINNNEIEIDITVTYNDFINRYM